MSVPQSASERVMESIADHPRSSMIYGEHATKEDLESFKACLALLKESYEDRGEIPRTVIQLLHLYNPEDGREAYLRLVIILSVLLQNVGRDILSYVTSIIPPPNCNDNEDWLSISREVEKIIQSPLLRITAFHTRVMPKLVIPTSISSQTTRKRLTYGLPPIITNGMSKSSEDIDNEGLKQPFMAGNEIQSCASNSKVNTAGETQYDLSQTKSITIDSANQLPHEITKGGMHGILQCTSIQNDKIYASASSGSESCIEEIESNKYKFYVMSNLETSELSLSSKTASNYALKYIRKQNSVEQEFLRSMDIVNLEFDELSGRNSANDYSIPLEDTENIKEIFQKPLPENHEGDDVLTSAIKSFLLRAYLEREPFITRKSSKNLRHNRMKRDKCPHKGLNKLLFDCKPSNNITSTAEISVSKSSERISNITRSLNLLSESEGHENPSQMNMTLETKSEKNHRNKRRKMKDEKSLESNMNANVSALQSIEEKRKQPLKRTISEVEIINKDDESLHSPNKMPYVVPLTRASLLSKIFRNTDISVSQNPESNTDCQQSEGNQNENTKLTLGKTEKESDDAINPNDILKDTLLLCREFQNSDNKPFELDFANSASNISESGTLPPKEFHKEIVANLLNIPDAYRNEMSSDYVCYLQNTTAVKNYDQNKTASSSSTTTEESKQMSEMAESVHHPVVPIAFSCSGIVTSNQPHLTATGTFSCSGVSSPKQPPIFSFPNEKIVTRGPHIPSQFAAPLTTWASSQSIMLQPSATLNLQHPPKLSFTTKRLPYVSIPMDYKTSQANIDSGQGTKSHSEILGSTPVSCSMEPVLEYSSLHNTHSSAKRGTFGSNPFEYQSVSPKVDHLQKSHNSDMLQPASVPCGLEAPSSHPNLNNYYPFLLKPNRLWNYHTLRHYPGANTSWPGTWARSSGRAPLMQPPFGSTINRTVDTATGFWEPVHRMYPMGQMPGIPRSSFAHATGYTTHQRGMQPGIFHVYPDCSTNPSTEHPRPVQPPQQHRRRKLEEIVDHLKEVEKNN